MSAIADWNVETCDSAGIGTVAETVIAAPLPALIVTTPVAPLPLPRLLAERMSPLALVGRVVVLPVEPLGLEVPQLPRTKQQAMSTGSIDQ